MAGDLLPEPGAFEGAGLAALGFVGLRAGATFPFALDFGSLSALAEADMPSKLVMKDVSSKQSVMLHSGKSALLAVSDSSLSSPSPLESFDELSLSESCTTAGPDEAEANLPNFFDIFPSSKSLTPSLERNPET